MPHIEEWQRAVDEFSERVPELSKAVEKLIKEERLKSATFNTAFADFYALCQQAINPNLSEDAVERMLVQHLLTERIFRKIFNNPDFSKRNVVAAEIEKVITELTRRAFNRDEFLKRLEPFYHAIEVNAENATDFSEKQHFLNTVYERFFQGYSPKEADTHGIVYTPQSIVNFMVRSVEEILQKEFGRSLGDKGVHILDPFVGTGNFIVRIMQEIKTTDLLYKYENELHCNEVMLLPYYIASMNIEHAYYERTGHYSAFPGICLVDTFELAESKQVPMFTEQNTERVERQKQERIFVVIGNPPYNAWQLNENDNNKNRKYAAVDAKVSETYGKSSSATNKNALSDMYVKAFLWATERIEDEGIVAFVSNNGFLNAIAFDGMRKHLANSFSTIYHLDLKGNARTSGERRRREGGNIFEDAIRVGVGITLLVRSRKRDSSTCNIRIFSVADYLSYNEKKEFLDANPTLGLVNWEIVRPDAHYTWLTEGLQGDFPSFLPVESGDENAQSLFRVISNGAKTNRDAWAYNFEASELERNISTMIAAYNDNVDRWQRRTNALVNIDDFVTGDDRVISWSETLKKRVVAGEHLAFAEKWVMGAMYRPYVRQHVYFDPVLVERRYQFPRIFPTQDTPPQEPMPSNMVICVTAPGSTGSFRVLMTNITPDIHCVGDSQCFPFYTYDEDGTNRRENITDWALEQFRSHYANPSITKWDIFHYVYAVLHHSEYRERYAANLRRELPRIPFVGASGAKAQGNGDADAAINGRSITEVFRAFVTAGRRLAEIHVEYEKQPECPLTKTEKAGEKLDYRVEKMRLSKDKTTLTYNRFLTLSGIPKETYEYRLGNRSALEWVIDQYQVSTDKRSGITNNPNRADDPTYILRLIGQVVTVSLETVKIVSSLPPLITP